MMMPSIQQIFIYLCIQIEPLLYKSRVLDARTAILVCVLTCSLCRSDKRCSGDIGFHLQIVTILLGLDDLLVRWFP